jgi:hypothetical protein
VPRAGNSAAPPRRDTFGLPRAPGRPTPRCSGRGFAQPLNGSIVGQTVMTEQQEKDLRRLRRYVQEEQLVSVMNDTKWRELRQIMIERPRRPRYRVQSLLSPPANPDSWEGDWYYHLPTFVWIEWLDIDPIFRTRRGHLLEEDKVDLTGELVPLLEAQSIPFELGAPFIRIYGYRRPAG